MSLNSGFDFRPSVPLLALGGVLGFCVLLWVWLRSAEQESQQARLRRLCALTLFLCFDLVLFGSFTRLSDSGLGCPDWPGCYGFVSPIGAGADIGAAHQLMPQGPVSWSKAWIEMIHRYAAMTVGFLILIMCIEAWRQALQHKRLHGISLSQPMRVAVGCSSLTLLWVMLQGLFGALTVTTKLFPAIVSMHLMGGEILLVLLVVQWHAYQGLLPAPRTLQSSAVQTSASEWSLGVSSGPEPVTKSLSWGPWLLMGALILALQIALGAWVSTNYAVLACQTFPLCQDAWWPEMNFSQGFELWRPLGLTSDHEPLVFQALTAIHYTHRLMAYVVFLGLGLLALKMYRSKQRRLSVLLLAALVLQLLTGLSNVVLGWPMIGAILHVGGASALVIVLTWSAFVLLQPKLAGVGHAQS
jgi:cytochrome c oxidase assembly protein subunit 15